MAARRKGLCLALSIAAAGIPAAPAHAHAELTETAPRPSQALNRSPGGVLLRFDEPVDAPRGAVRVLSPSGRDVVLTTAAGTTAVVQAQLLAHLDAGKYVVQWHVVADDGHAVSGSYRFKIRRAAGSRAASQVAAQQTAVPAADSDDGGTGIGTILLVAALSAIGIAALSLVAIRREGAPQDDASDAGGSQR